MKTPALRRTAAALVTAPLLAGCGFNVATDAVYQPAVGVNDRDGSIDILGAVIVAAEGDTGTFVATLVNNDLDNEDQWTAITAGEEAKLGEPVAVPADGLVNLADAGAASVSGADVTPGRWVEVTMDFANGQSTELLVPVVQREEEFASVKMAQGQKPLILPAPETHEEGH